MLTVSQSLFALKILTVLGCGLIAGVFFAFSTSVMKALGERPPTEGIGAMQSINIVIINPWFMSAILGTTVACLFLAIFSLWQWQQPVSSYLLIGSLLYIVGCFGVTMVFNVPLNDALAIAKPDSPEGATLWARYLTDWTFWNTVRTIASLVASGLIAIAIGH
jgi:uncharacterized membrane protein